MQVSTTIKKAQIGEIALARMGINALPSEQGTIPFIQVRQFDAVGNYHPEETEFVVSDNVVESNLLKNNDVLFVGKGNRLFAWCFSQKGSFVASTSFFVLKPDPDKILPGYLSAYLNSLVAKSALAKMGGGTNILSIRKSELEAFPIPVPDLQIQAKIADYADLHSQEINLLRKLIAEKKSLYDGVISGLTNNKFTLS